jgi:RNA polymerase sigma-54 factor
MSKYSNSSSTDIATVKNINNKVAIIYNDIVSNTYVESKAKKRRVIEIIVKTQRNFFLTGKGIVPLRYLDISQILGINVSTVGRIINGRTINTQYGRYDLKYFFSNEVKTSSNDTVSTRELKNLISDLILREEKHDAYSDQELTNLLDSLGYKIARRTVAKYRREMMIPPGWIRKKQ